MLKLAIIGCLCAIVAIKGQQMPSPPGGVPKPPTGPIPRVNSRVARQANPMESGGQRAPDTQPGNAGNLGMHGLGNIPDPTAVIAKVQEMGKQFMGGRRRRHLSMPTF